MLEAVAEAAATTARASPAVASVFALLPLPAAAAEAAAPQGPGAPSATTREGDTAAVEEVHRLASESDELTRSVGALPRVNVQLRALLVLQCTD